MDITIWVVVAIAAIGGFGIWGFNTVVRAKVRVQAAWAQIEVQLKRRYDLIPNLVETVKGYATHERSTFDAVTAARANAINATSPADAASADNMLTGALKSLFAVAEAYPDLKASTNFLALQEELSTTENKVAFARQYYNDAVRTLNTMLATFPLMLFKGAAKPAEFFDAPDAAADAPTVSF
jgi:LemA protein